MPVQLSIELSLPVGIDKKETFLTDRLGTVLEREMHLMHRWFGKTTATWDHEVEFEASVKKFNFGFGTLIANIFTNDLIYFWVNDPRRRGRVQFSRNYSPKTKPGRLKSTAGSGRVYARGRKAGVKRSAVEPRLFNFLIAEERERPLVNNITKAIEVAIKHRLFGRTKMITFTGNLGL